MKGFSSGLLVLVPVFRIYAVPLPAALVDYEFFLDMTMDFWFSSSAAGSREMAVVLGVRCATDLPSQFFLQSPSIGFFPKALNRALEGPAGQTKRGPGSAEQAQSQGTSPMTGEVGCNRSRRCLGAHFKTLGVARLH